WVVVRLGGKRRLSGPASSLPQRLLAARVVAQFPRLRPQDAVRITGSRAALQVAFRCESERTGIGQRGGGSGVKLLEKPAVVGLLDVGAGEFSLQPAARSHGVAVTSEERVRLPGEVHLLHAGDGISPDGCQSTPPIRPFSQADMAFSGAKRLKFL